MVCIQRVKISSCTTWYIFKVLKYLSVPRGLYSTCSSAYLCHVACIQHVELPTCTTWPVFNALKYLSVPGGMYSTRPNAYLYHVVYIQHVEVLLVLRGVYSARSTHLYHVVYIRHVGASTCTTWSVFNTLKYLPVPRGLYSTR